MRHYSRFQITFHCNVPNFVVNFGSSLRSSKVHFRIDLFINRDAILNRDALWSIQGKNHYLQVAIVGGILHTGKILR